MPYVKCACDGYICATVDNDNLAKIGDCMISCHLDDNFIGANTCYYYKNSRPELKDFKKIFDNKIKLNECCVVLAIVVLYNNEIVEVRKKRILLLEKIDKNQVYNDIEKILDNYYIDLIMYVNDKYDDSISTKFYFNYIN